MLVIYDKETGKVIAINGVKPNGRKLSDAEKNVTLAEALPDTLMFLSIQDEVTMDKVFDAITSGLNVYIRRNETGDLRVELPDMIPNPASIPQPPPEPTFAELQEQQLAQAEAIAAIFERLEGGL